MSLFHGLSLRLSCRPRLSLYSPGFRCKFQNYHALMQYVNLWRCRLPNRNKSIAHHSPRNYRLDSYQNYVLHRQCLTPNVPPWGFLPYVLNDISSSTIFVSSSATFCFAFPFHFSLSLYPFALFFPFQLLFFFLQSLAICPSRPQL